MALSYHGLSWITLHVGYIFISCREAPNNRLKLYQVAKLQVVRRLTKIFGHQRAGKATKLFSRTKHRKNHRKHMGTSPINGDVRGISWFDDGLSGRLIPAGSLDTKTYDPPHPCCSGDSSALRLVPFHPQIYENTFIKKRSNGTQVHGN